MRSLSLAATTLLALSQWGPLVHRASHLAPFGGWLNRVGRLWALRVRTWKAAWHVGILPAGVGLIAAAILPALAYASPPDPGWIQGLYDDADYDDVVALATSGSGSAATAAPDNGPPLRQLSDRLLPSDERPRLDLQAFAVQARGPPAS